MSIDRRTFLATIGAATVVGPRLVQAMATHLATALETADTSERATARERLAAMGETVANLSHSVKNILQALRGGADDAAIGRLLLECVAAKKPAHGIDTPDFERPARAMYQIGG